MLPGPANFNFNDLVLVTYAALDTANLWQSLDRRLAAGVLLRGPQ